MTVRRDAVGEYVRGALWVLPGAAAVAALVLGGVLSLVHVPVSSPLFRLVFQGTADDARTLLIGIAGTMITVIALVLGLTVVALQLSSTQYSPRLLRNFLRDRPNQLVLSAFVATFAYSTAGLYTVGVSGGSRTTEVPRLAITGAIVLLFVSLAALVFEVHHLSHSMQVDEIMLRVERDTRRVIEHQPVGVDDVSTTPIPADAGVILAPHSGYVQAIHVDGVAAAARAQAVNVALTTRVGMHVVANATPLARVWRAGAAPAAPSASSAPSAPADLSAMAAAVDSGVRIGFERTLEQDIGFGIRQLVDIASKALSPAVNDPYTAVQAVDHLTVIVCALASKALGPSVDRDRSDVAVIVAGPTFADHLDLACAQIRRYGASEPTVDLALVRLLRLATACTSDPARRSAIAEQLTLIARDSERDIAQPIDFAAVRVELDELSAQLGDAGAHTR